MIAVCRESYVKYHKCDFYAKTLILNIDESSDFFFNSKVSSTIFIFKKNNKKFTIKLDGFCEICYNQRVLIMFFATDGVYRGAPRRNKELVLQPTVWAHLPLYTGKCALSVLIIACKTGNVLFFGGRYGYEKDSDSNGKRQRSSDSRKSGQCT